MSDNNELDPKAALFSLSKAMMNLYGVAYSEIMTDLHDDNQFFLTEYDNGARTHAQVSALAKRIGYESGFISVEEKGPEYARGYNIAKAGMLAHAAAHDEWKRGSEGTLYRHYDGGVLAMHPNQDAASGNWQYVAVQFEGAELDRLMTRMVTDGTPVKHYFGRIGQINEEIAQLNLDVDAKRDLDEAPSFNI